VDRDRAARGHIVLAQGPVPTPVDYLPRAYGPGGNISSTVRDVLTLAGALLGPETEMTRSRVPIPDPYMFGPAWALGLIVCDWHGETVYATDGSTIGQNARLRVLPGQNAAITMLTNGGPRESFYKKVFNEILSEMDAPTIPDLPTPDPTLALDLSRYEGVYERPGTHYEVASEAGRLYLTVAVDPMEAEFLGKPDHNRYELRPISETHFLLPPTSQLEDPQTAAIYDFQDGKARYLHTNCRVTPRAG
jgi:beta-lactamase family protein